MFYEKTRGFSVDFYISVTDPSRGIVDKKKNNNNEKKNGKWYIHADNDSDVIG